MTIFILAVWTCHLAAGGSSICQDEYQPAVYRTQAQCERIAAAVRVGAAHAGVWGWSTATTTTWTSEPITASCVRLVMARR